jgi:hypothetical protein
VTHEDSDEAGDGGHAVAACCTAHPSQAESSSSPPGRT